MQQRNRNKQMLFGMVVLVSVCLRGIHLGIPIGNDFHAFRQTQTAITIQNYFRDGWSLFHYETPVFGKPWQALMECPIYQTAVYAVMRLFGQTDIDFWCRAVSLAVFYGSAWMLKKTADLFVKGDAGLFICSVYLLSAFNIYWSRAAMIDFMSVLFALLYVWGLYGWLLAGKKKAYGIGLAAGCLGYLLKATTMFPYVYLLVLVISTRLCREVGQSGEKQAHRRICCYLRQNWKRMLLLANICIVPAAAGAFWTAYADAVKKQSEYTAWLASASLSAWNYGTWEQKCEIQNWKVIIERLYSFFGGGIVFCALLAGYLVVFRKRNVLALAYSFAACIFAIGTLFNLYYVHDYYFMAVSPLVCSFIGILLFEIKEAVWQDGNAGKVCFGILCAVFVSAQMKSGQPYLDGIFYGNKEANSLAGYVQEITDEDECLVIEGQDWNPATLYYAGRKGFMVKMAEWLAQDSFFDFINQDQYTTLVAHSMTAVEAFAKRYSRLVQYPGKAGAYVYKFNEKPATGEEAPVLHGKIDAVQMDTEYAVTGCGAGDIAIRYEDTGVSRKIRVEITDSEGNVMSDEVCLPTGCGQVFYRIRALCQNPAAIKFSSEDSEIKGLCIEY